MQKIRKFEQVVLEKNSKQTNREMDKYMEGVSYDNSTISVPGFIQKNLHVGGQLSMTLHLFLRKKILYIENIIFQWFQ